LKQEFLIPTITVCAAHFFDIIFARWDESLYGTRVYDKNYNLITNGNEPLLSKRAGRIALFQTFEQRCFTVVVTLALCSFFDTLCTNLKLSPKSIVLNTLLRVSMVGVGLTISVPLSLGIFQKYLEFKSEELENNFHHLKENGKSSLVYVYRGD